MNALLAEYSKIEAEFKRLFPDLQFREVMNMKDRDLVNLCSTSPKMRDYCNNSMRLFWLYRAQNKFDIDPDDPAVQQMLQNTGNWFRVYLTILNLNKLRQKIPKLSQYTPIELYNLKHLDLSHNQLTELPSEISNLANLQKLNLDNNQLTELPTSIGQLTNLQELRLANNQLRSPERIKQLLPNVKIYF